MKPLVPKTIELEPVREQCSHTAQQFEKPAPAFERLFGDDDGEPLLGLGVDDSARVLAPERERESLLTFEHADGYWPGNLTLQASPMRPFKPRGLMLWNVAGLNVEAAIIGNVHQLVASCGAIPAEWFTTSQNFEQVVEALKAGKEPGRGWGDWDRLYPGVVVRLLLTKPPHYREPDLPQTIKALMWGHSPS